MTDSCSKCKRRYHCCINPPSKGYVTIYINEAKKIKKKTGLEYKEFLTYTKLPDWLITASRHDTPCAEARFRAGMMINGKILRLKTQKSGECVFYKNEKCSIYSIRPSICRIYPYWFKQTKKGIELIIHTGCEYCALIDEEHENEKMTLKQKKELIKIAKEIIKQKKHYKKNIKEFIQKTYL